MKLLILHLTLLPECLISSDMQKNSERRKRGVRLICSIRKVAGEFAGSGSGSSPKAMNFKLTENIFENELSNRKFSNFSRLKSPFIEEIISKADILSDHFQRFGEIDRTIETLLSNISLKWIFIVDFLK